MVNKNGSGVVLSSFAYTYSADGNILSETDHNGAFTNYTYNMLGRLVSEIGNSGSRYYTYDAAGNRTQAIIDTTTTISYTYNTAGQLAYEISNNSSTSETTTYTYDLNGNLVSKSTPLSTTSYTYNVWGNMTAGAGATYGYNAQGLRTSKTVNSETDNFVLVGGNVWSDGEADYFRGIELISNGTNLYLYNIRGDAIQLADYAGNVVKTYDYDAYGNELQRDLNDENPFRYCGEYYDTETGFVYLRARYYDPMVGRFTAMDTHWNPSNAIYGDNPVKTSRAEDCKSLYPNINAIKQSSNQCVYCVDNPLAYRDSIGKWVVVIPLNLNASIFAWGFFLSVGLAFDGEGNVAMVYSDSYMKDGSPRFLSICSAGISSGLQYYWNGNVYDLEGVSTTAGFSYGSGLFFGADMVSGEEEYAGLSASVGYGFGVDAHIVESETEITYVFETKDKSENDKPRKKYILPPGGSGLMVINAYDESRDTALVSHRR